MIYFEKFFIKYSAFILLFLFFIDLLLQSFIKGGRWDLYQHFSMADKIIRGESIYSTFDDGFYQASSPYFPGISFFTFIITKINIEFRKEIMLFFSVSIGVIFIYLLSKVKNKINGSLDINSSFVLTLLLFIWFFKDWRFYMTELKPDTILILLAIGVFFTIDKIERTPANKLNYLFLLIYLYFIGIIKQQGISIYVGVFTYFLLCNKNDFIVRMFVLSTIILSGIFVLVTLYSTENCINNTIIIFSKHQFLNLGEIKTFLINDFNSQWLVYILVFTTINLMFLKRVKINNLEKLWLFISIPWLLMCLISYVKIGGNNGNIQSGLIPLIPIILSVLQKTLIKSVFTIKFIQMSLFFSVIIIFLNIRESYKIYNLTNEIESNHINFLKKYKNKNVLYNSNYYDILIKSGVLPKTDMNTAYDFYLANTNMDNYYNHINNKKYDLILADLSEYKDVDLQRIIFKRYKFYKQKDIPVSLAYKILVPKK